MLGVAILLGAAAVGYLAARWLDLPPVPLLLLAGVALSATGLVQADFLGEALVLGVAFLLFATGIELNPGRTRTQRRAALRVGLVQFAVHAMLGFGAALALGFRALDAVYLALALTASSTLVVIRLLQRRRQMYEPSGRLVVGVLLLQDLLIILLVPFVTALAGGVAGIALGVVGVATLLALAWAGRRWASPLLVRLDGDDESLLLATLALLFLFVGLADMLGLPVVVGAFLAGVTLSRFPVSGIVRPQLAPVGDFFSAVFFTALGALIGIPTPIQLLQAIILALLVVVGTPPVVAWIAERVGFSARPALEAGLLLAQTSEISLVLGLYGMMEEQIAPDVFRVIAMVTMITMMLTPLLASDRVVWRLMRLHPVRAEDRIVPPAGGHILVLGSGSTGLPLVETLLLSGNEVVVVDDDPAVVQRLREADVACIRGDASDLSVLRDARARSARIITSTIRRPEDNRRLLEYVRDVPVLVRVFDEEDAAWVRAMGGIPVLYSEATAEGFLRWLERHEAERPGEEPVAAAPS